MSPRAFARCALFTLTLLGCQTTQNPPMFERFSWASTPEADRYPGVGGVVLLSRGLLSFFVEPELKIPVAKDGADVPGEAPAPAEPTVTPAKPAPAPGAALAALCFRWLVPALPEAAASIVARRPDAIDP